MAAAEDDLRLWYKKPAEYWTEALPLGNGKLGAMVFGGTSVEKIQLNEGSLWTGYPKDWNNPEAKSRLPKVREAVFEGRYVEATELAKGMLGNYAQYYEPLGALSLSFGPPLDKPATSKYLRQLDLRTAVSTVAFTSSPSQGPSVDVVRQGFVSYPDKVMALRLTTGSPGALSFSLSIDGPLKTSCLVNSQEILVYRGECRRDLPSVDDRGGGLSFAAVVEVRMSFRGRLEAKEGSDSLHVAGADWALILVAASSSFEGPFVAPEDSKKDPVAACLETLAAVRFRPWEDLLERHLADHQSLFRTVEIQLSGSSVQTSLHDHGSSPSPEIDGSGRIKAIVSSAWERSKAWAAKRGVSFNKGSNADASSEPRALLESGQLATDERLKAFQDNHDPAMVTLLFQYGRYLLISSSRPGGYGANLQGIWNESLNPPWGSGFTTNINAEMNYWAAETCNLAECHIPLFQLVRTLAANGATTAQVNYGLEGWVAHHQSDLWGQTGPAGGEAVWSLWPMAGAWLALHLWDHYLFLPDQGFLGDAYPILRGAALFLLRYVVEDGRGHLVTCPSTSPEHMFSCKDGRQASVAYGSTMDMAITHDLFSACISASQVLGNSDDEFADELRLARARLLPPAIGSSGLVLEWGEEFSDPEPGHRHLSHLFGLYPGHSLAPDKTPDLCEAAAKSISARGEEGPGWSVTWKLALWARLGKGERAYRMVARMFYALRPDGSGGPDGGGGLFPNLFNSHPPFQIDGNFGFATGLAEMLLQSRGGTGSPSEIFCLPTLPGDRWPSGTVAGLRARGGWEVDLAWSQGTLKELFLKCLHPEGGQAQVRYKGHSTLVSLRHLEGRLLDGSLRQK